MRVKCPTCKKVVEGVEGEDGHFYCPKDDTQLTETRQYPLAQGPGMASIEEPIGSPTAGHDRI